MPAYTEEECKEAIYENPNDVSAWCNLGNFYLNSEDHQKAAGCFIKALEIEPDNYEALNQLNILHNQSEMQNQNPGRLKRLLESGGIIAVIIGILLKFSKLGFLINLFKFKTLFTMFISIGAYALIFGLPFAIGIIVMLFIHETGHWVALRYYGINVSSPIFVPFLGAAVFAKEMPKRVYHEAITAVAGPFFGFLITIAFLIIGLMQKSGLFLALAYFSGFVNLFNLIPFGFLDGGRIAKVISKKMWIIGAIMLLSLFIIMPNPFFLIILILLAWGYFEERKQEQFKNMEIEFYERIIIGVIYILLLVFLGILTVLSYEELQVIHPI